MLPGGVDVAAELLLRLRRGIRCDDIESTRQIERAPARADHSGSDNCDATNGFIQWHRCSFRSFLLVVQGACRRQKGRPTRPLRTNAGDSVSGCDALNRTCQRAGERAGGLAPTSGCTCRPVPSAASMVVNTGVVVRAADEPPAHTRASSTLLTRQ